MSASNQRKLKKSTTIDSDTDDNALSFSVPQVNGHKETSPKKSPVSKPSKPNMQTSASFRLARKSSSRDSLSNSTVRCLRLTLVRETLRLAGVGVGIMNYRLKAVCSAYCSS